MLNFFIKVYVKSYVKKYKLININDKTHMLLQTNQKNIEYIIYQKKLYLKKYSK